MLAARLNLIPRALRLTATLEAIQPSTPLSLSAVAEVVQVLERRSETTTVVLVVVETLAEQTLVRALRIKALTVAQAAMLAAIPITVVVVAVPLKLAEIRSPASELVMAVTAFSPTSLVLVFTVQAVGAVALFPMLAALAALAVGELVVPWFLARLVLQIPEAVVEQGVGSLALVPQAALASSSSASLTP